MCLVCHQGLTDEVVLKQIDDILKEIDEGDTSDFIKWNTTSVSHIILAGLGLNGPEVRFKAIKLLEHFIEWRKTKSDNYIPESGIEKMTSVYDLETDLNYIKLSNPDYTDKHSIIQKYTEYNTNKNNKNKKQSIIDIIYNYCSIQ